MSEDNLRSKTTGKNDSKRAIEDWLNGDGGKVMALAMIALGIWFVVRLPGLALATPARLLLLLSQASISA